MRVFNGLKRAKDHTGKKYGSISVLGFVGRQEAGARALLWECRCDCGRVFVVSAGRLLEPRKQARCGNDCSLPPLIPQMIGKVFGFWTVVSVHSGKDIGKRRTHCTVKCKCGHIRMLALSTLKSGNSKSCGNKCPIRLGIFRVGCDVKRKCYKCGAIKLLNDFVSDPNRSQGCQGICKACAASKTRQDRRRQKDANPQLYYLIERHKSYRGFDKKRGWSTFTREECLDVITGPCVFCGWLSMTEFNTADRIDNTKGHDKNNVQSACIVCNILKQNRFSNEEMFLFFGPMVKRAREERMRILGRTWNDGGLDPLRSSNATSQSQIYSFPRSKFLPSHLAVDL